MSRVDELISRVAPNGVKFQPLGDVVQLKFGTRITKMNDTGTVYPVYGGGGESFRTDSFNREDDFVISRFAMSENCVRKVTGKFWMLDSGFTFDSVSPEVLKEYVAHWLFSHQSEIYACSTQGAQKNLKTAKFKSFRIPIPPLEVQRELVRVLDLFSELETELEAELEARRKHYDHYLNYLTSHVDSEKRTKQGWTATTIGKVGRVVKGSTAIQKATGGDYPLVTTSSERRSSASFEFDAQAVCIPLVSSKGHGVASLSRIYYQSGKFALGNILCAVIPNDSHELSAEFLYYYLQARKDFLLVPLMRGGANVSLTVDSLKPVPIHVPPLREQRQIVEAIRTIESLLTDPSSGLQVELAARRKQHEHYRDKLLKFAELAA